MHGRYDRDARKAMRFAALSLLLVTQMAWASSAERSESGKALAFERGKGNCLACHRIDDGELPGTLGPALFAMKLRYPEREALVRQICDATIRLPDSRMPPFCRHGILTRDEVELIVDYLYTL